jgi:putative hemolysin
MTTPNIAQNAFVLAPFPADGPLHADWNAVDVLTSHGDVRGRYIAGFANSDRCVEAALRLRYEVFNLELGEGLPASVTTGLDRDELDAQMSHLVLLEAATHNVVGTYRMQTAVHALKNRGLYSARQYDVTALEPYLPRAVELGRACLAREHRILSAIMQLWLGIGAFMNRYDQHYLFGCSSITTIDPGDGWRAMKTIRENGCLHPELWLPARPPFSCGDPNREFAPDLGDALRLPKLFRTYIRLGARVISEPTIDAEFGSVDFLVMIDGREVTLSSLDVLK